MDKKLNLQIENRDSIPALLKRLDLNGAGVEIGVQNGIFSETILKFSNLKRLYSIDCWKSMDKNKYLDIANKSQIKQYYYYLKTILRLFKFGKRSRIIRKFSKEASLLFKDESLDFIYIDAQHSYAACKEDINCWWPKLKKNGILAGHDYLNGVLLEGEFGVKKAVDEFIKNTKSKLFVTKEDWPTWYLVKK